jgi:hypothetical protein
MNRLAQLKCCSAGPGIPQPKTYQIKWSVGISSTRRENDRMLHQSPAKDRGQMALVDKPNFLRD